MSRKHFGRRPEAAGKMAMARAMAMAMIIRCAAWNQEPRFLSHRCYETREIREVNGAIEYPILTTRSQLLPTCGGTRTEGMEARNRRLRAQRPRGIRKVESRKRSARTSVAERERRRLCERYDVGIQLKKPRSVWSSRPRSGSRLGLLPTLRLTHVLVPIKAYYTLPLV
jgi:hypothetical protein